MADKTLLLNSKKHPDQNPNDLTIYLDEELQNIQGVRIIYVGIPCTFYNISQEIGNNNLSFYDGSRWKYLNIPDGLYDLKSFEKQISSVLKNMGLNPRMFKFDVEETNGKISISFKKSKAETFKIYISNYNKDLLGFNTPIELPRRIRDPKNPSNIITEDVSIGDKSVNFKPFDYFHIHCDLLDSENILNEGKRSDILARIPVKECDFGEINAYYLTGLRDRKCKGRFNKLRIWITDENDEKINFNGGNIQYELLFLHNK